MSRWFVGSSMKMVLAGLRHRVWLSRRCGAFATGEDADFLVGGVAGEEESEAGEVAHFPAGWR